MGGRRLGRKKLRANGDLIPRVLILLAKQYPISLGQSGRVASSLAEIQLTLSDCAITAFFIRALPRGALRTPNQQEWQTKQKNRTSEDGRAFDFLSLDVPSDGKRARLLALCKTSCGQWPPALRV